MKRFPVKSSLRVKIIIIILFCLQLPLYSQTVAYIEGKVINSFSRKPVQFATIKLKNKQLGVYANAEGDFKIINNPEFLNDSLIISCIGFKRSSVAFKDLNQKKVNQIFLNPSVYNLAEVKIQTKKTKVNSFAIVSKAINNIKKNYPEKPFNFIAYYRDYQKRDSDYFNLNEAIIQTLDNGFSEKSNTNNYRLLDFRKNIDFPRLDISPYYNSGAVTNNNKYKNIPFAILGDQNGNELFVLMVHDALRNFNTQSFSFIDIFNENFLFNHSFDDPVAIYNNKLLLYRIPFSGRSRATGAYWQVSGAIYIQPKDYSIHKLEYTCLYNEKGYKPMFNVDIEYGYENSVDSMMCLKYISFNNIFNVNNNDDNRYFKIRDSNWNSMTWKENVLQKPTITVEFNRLIDPVSAGRKENYIIKIGRNAGLITKVKIKDKNKVSIELSDLDFNDFPGRLSNKRKKMEQYLRDSTSVQARNILDKDSDILNRRKTTDLYQYRELFVQEYNKFPQFQNSCLMQYLPLEQNCISKLKGDYNYWMNTPENIRKK